ncbi:disease resistance-like protein DSC1 isoform X2 [Citrus clementina]|uniref:disease resistance-like protein DSC1 isoform X2 n=1 Tax=Citrus clementina TaxID=85681 RepID=UPI000CED7A5B|nr:disease resistance-like protein DSC1 isoform X2 [Citrus x clementina]
MSNLRLLKFYVPEIERFLSMSFEEQLSYSKVQLRKGLDYLPKKLRYLHWDTYPLRTLPSNFKPKNLVELNLRFSKVEQLWEGEKACVPSSIQNFKYLSALSFEGCKSLMSFPSNLRFVCPVTINFSCCVNLKEFPQISGKVTSLNLGYTAIEEVPSSIECLTHLVELDLRFCKRLKRISTRFCKLRSLVKLFLYGCLNLERFPEILEKMEHLNHIGLVWTALPSPFENLPGLVILSVSGCSILDMLPNNIGNLSGNNFESLPASIKQLSWLRYLDLEDCNMLQSLPELPLCLKYLELRDCKILQSLPELPLGLETLRLRRCNMLQSLPALPLGLETIDLEDCNMLQSLPELPLCLQSLNAMNCNRLQSLPEIPSCVQELDASVLEKLSKPSPDLRQWHPEYVTPQPIYFGFTNCLKLDGKANNKILADSLRMAIAASLRLGYENAYNEVSNSLSCLLCPSFTLNFGTEVWKLDDLPSASGTATSEFDSSSDEGELYYSFDEEELEPSPKRICRADQINTS